MLTEPRKKHSVCCRILKSMHTSDLKSVTPENLFGLQLLIWVHLPRN